MPVCPKCGKSISVLVCVQVAERSYEVSLNENFELHCEVLDNYTDIRDEEYRCSECGATLFKTHHEAKDFLSSLGSG